MKKLKETKNILKEWRKFEFKEKLNESQGSPAPLTRVKHKPTKEALDLKKELEDKYGKDSFYCYDNFDNHSDEEMIDPDTGYQIELDSLTEHIKGIPGFPNDVELADIVMSEDDVFLDAVRKNSNNAYNNGLGIDEKGSFDVEWPTLGQYQGNKQKYFYGDIDVNGRKQKVVYKNEHGYTIYWLWPVSAQDSSKSQKVFSIR